MCDRRVALPLLSIALLLIALPVAAQSARVGPPFPVQNVNPSVHQVFASGSLTGAFVFDEIALDPVPTGKRFVVELVSADVLAAPGQVPRILITTGGSSAFYAIPLVKQGAAGIIGDVYRAALPLRFYLDAGVAHFMNIERDPSGGAATFLVTLSGYLIDLP